jgi:hypothetical protein
VTSVLVLVRRALQIHIICRGCVSITYFMSLEPRGSVFSLLLPTCCLERTRNILASDNSFAGDSSLLFLWIIYMSLLDCCSGTSAKCPRGWYLWRCHLAPAPCCYMIATSEKFWKLPLFTFSKDSVKAMEIMKFTIGIQIWFFLVSFLTVEIIWRIWDGFYSS